jgi:hypothetical protein
MLCDWRVTTSIFHAIVSREKTLYIGQIMASSHPLESILPNTPPAQDAPAKPRTHPAKPLETGALMPNWLRLAERRDADITMEHD